MHLEESERRILGILQIDLDRVVAWISKSCACGDGQARFDYLRAWLARITKRGRIDRDADRRHLDAILIAGERIDAASARQAARQWQWWINEPLTPEVITYVSFD